MKRRPSGHIAWIVLLIPLMGACDRGNPGASNADITITGYRIEGKLLDEFQRPLVGVEVLLYYGIALLSSDSISRAYTPAVQGEVVTVHVKDTTGQVVRILFSGPAPQDSDLYVFWDGRNDSGNVVRSGIYTVSYEVANAVKKSYRLIVDGNQIAVTDAAGSFIIPGLDLPVGAVALLYDSADAFVGQFEITNEVFLRFVTPSFDRTVRVSLVKDKITNFSAVLN